MSDIDNDGPAFPTDRTAIHEAKPGMTLRDWFASQASIGHDDPHPELATAIMGSDIPNWHADPVAASEWWAMAEAKLRYIKADAMIAARKGADA